MRSRPLSPRPPLRLLLAPLLIQLVGACGSTGGGLLPAGRPSYEHDLRLLGHRNWVAVVDSAYPLQSRAGIRTVYRGGDLTRELEDLLAAVDALPHLRGKIYVDRELAYVREQDAPGIGAYRGRLAAVLEGRRVVPLAHQELIDRLDQAGRSYDVRVYKTDLALPYTSVFVELDCGYWDAASEARLRGGMSGE